MDSYEKRTWWSRHKLTARLAEAGFLEAAVTAAFVIAASDGNASVEEYDALLDRMEILGNIDRDRIDEHMTAAANLLEASGFEPLVARVGELVEGREAAEAALMVAMAVALADDNVSDEERELATQLAVALGLAAVDVDTAIGELRG
ncbi:MAG: hypothetical protein NT062_03170 [Proteobacteria bacterium]|nr:hypothetical protein [Pseudomonadota bacterium]